MSFEQSEALALRTYRFMETHKIAVFLAREGGIIRGVAHGAQGARSRFGSSLEPLTHLRLTYSRKENQDLATIRNCEIIRPFAAYGLSWEQSLHYSYFTELLLEFGREQEGDERLFRLALAVVSAVDAPVVKLARYFELWLLQLEGILPPLDRGLPADLALKIKKVMRQPPSELGEAILEDGELRTLKRFSERLIEEHLEKRLKSKRMIDELL